METKEKTRITVETTLNVPVQKVWEFWTSPKHITQWNHASDDWHSPRAENNLKVGGTFSARMEAKDGSAGFDFGGVYTQVKTNELIAFTMDDGREVKVSFIRDGNKTRIVETFDAESTNSIEMQRGGWQSIMDNFRKYAESKK